MTGSLKVCLLGFGEVGQALAPGLRTRVAALRAWDLQFSDAASTPSRAAPRLDVRAAPDARTAAADADLVISAVTAAQIVDAAHSVAPHLKRDAWFFDLNSTSPAAKRRAAQVIDGAGGRFVEAAIMSPIAPRGADSPMLLGGPHAAAFQPLAKLLGFGAAELMAGELGAASAAKMCRSVVVKGMEALLLESLLAARRHGVEGEVLESLRGLFPVQSWRSTGRYMISRALIHGKRRAEEMREAARTVEEAGLPARMSGACVGWQAWAARYPEAAAHEDLESLLDELLSTDRGEAA